MRFLLFAMFISSLVQAKQIEPLAKANWITVGYTDRNDKRIVPVFKKEFILPTLSQETSPSAEKCKATLYLTALGVYEARLNGKRGGKDYFKPGFTVYNKHLHYQMYDVGDLLVKGRNVLEVMVGEGWYRGTFRSLSTDTANNNFGRQVGVLAMIVVEYKDGTKDTINTNESWRFSESGIRYSEFYDGEMQESRSVVKIWKPVKLMEPYLGKLVASTAPPVRKQEQFSAKRKLITRSCEQVFDFGQNMAGWVQLSVHGKAGDTIRLYHAEMLDSSGNFYTGNLRNARAVDTYVLNGSRQILEPHFTYHGFRYVKVEGMRLSVGDLKAFALYSDLKKTGTFSCSDPMLNQLQSNIESSMKSNFVDIPTDCPQRSERLGWTGDAQVFAGTASFLRDTKSFYQKWLADVAAEQGKNGAIPNFVPTSSPYRDEFSGVAGWGDVATIVPWTLFKVYGDTAMLREQYPMMKRWVDYISSVSKDRLFMNRGYGDWYAMGDSTSIPFINQCFYSHSAALLAKAAKVLGNTEDALRYTIVVEKANSGFLEHYGQFDTKATSTQTAYLLALAFDLLPFENRQGVSDLLAEKIRENGNKLATGFLGTPHLLGALSDFGHEDLAFSLLLQQECPSWLYPVTKGATTIWERWDAVRPDGSLQQTSFNHYAYGAVGQWMYENIVGISVLEPGYKRVRIKPLIGGGLTRARGSYESSYGKIEVSWKLKGNKVILALEVPKETTAEVYIPGRSQSQLVGRGKHRFIGKILKQQLFN